MARADVWARAEGVIFCGHVGFGRGWRDLPEFGYASAEEEGGCRPLPSLDCARSGLLIAPKGACLGHEVGFRVESLRLLRGTVQIGQDAAC